MINRIRLLLIEFYHQNQAVLLFLGKALGLYFLWNILYHGVLIQWGINDPLTRWVAISSQKFCYIYEPQIHLEFIKKEYYLYFNHQSLVRIGDGCNGLELYALFIAFYMALGHLFHSLKWILIGIGGIYILNMIRIAGLAWVVLYRPSELDFHHKYTFALVVYSWMLLVWVVSLRRKKGT
jgi:exosortase family protein XrtF